MLNDAKGTFTLTGKCGMNNDHIEYAVENATHGKPVWKDGKVSVTFTADAGYANTDGETSWTVTKDEIDTTTDCGGGSLAYTGGFSGRPSGLGLMALVAGAALRRKFS